MNRTVAFQGLTGAFAEEACLRFLPDHQRLALESFEAVASAVAEGKADVGMLPQVNSSVGPVPGIDRLIAEAGLEIRSRHPLAVRIHLMAAPGARLEEITTVSSHPMALAQCRAFLAARGLAPEEAENTAVAARRLKESGERFRAVAASEAAARAHGLHILLRDIQDREDNVTTFCAVVRPGTHVP